MIGWKSLIWEENISPLADDYADLSQLEGRMCFVRQFDDAGVLKFQLIGPEDALAEIELRVFHDEQFPSAQYSYTDFDPKLIS